MAKIAQSTSIPIATGERLVTIHDFQKLFEEGACAIAQPDLGSCGGITACKQIATLAEAHYVLMAPHVWGGPVITAAALAVQCLATTGAQHGGPCTGAVRLRSDVERKRLLGLAPTHRPGPSVPATALYSADTTQRTYQRLQDLAAELLGFGQSVVVDAASLRQAEREALRQLAAQAGAQFMLLECVAPVDQMQARLAQRQAANTDPSDATPAVLAQQTTWAEPVPAHWAPVHRRIHNTGTLDDLRLQVAAALG